MLVFHDITDASEWLKRQSRDHIATIALRAALRAIPALETGQGFWSSHGGDDRDIVQAAIGYVAAGCVQIGATDAAPSQFGQARAVLRGYPARLDLYVEQSDVMFELREHDFVASALAAQACRLAHDASVQLEANALALAAGAIDAEMKAAAHACAGFRSVSADGERALLACAEDARLVEGGFSPNALLSCPLWAPSKPEWVEASWEKLKHYIRSRRPDLETWIGWYEERLAGLDAVSANSALADSAQVLSTDRTFDAQPPVRGQGEGVAEANPPDLTMRPAMIQPVWRDGRLTFDDETSPFDIGGETVNVALEVLHDALADLVENLSSESNCDPRTIKALTAVAAWTLDAAPSQRLIFKLGHAKDALEAGLGAITDEWAAIHAAQFQAIVLNLGRLVGHCKRWREYKQSSLPITGPQAEEASIFTASVAEVLEGEGGKIVDPAIPEALRYLSARSEDPHPRPEIAASFARDSLESSSNIMNRLIEEAVKQQTTAVEVTVHVITDTGKDGGRARLVWRILFAVLKLAGPLMAVGAGPLHTVFTYLAEQVKIRGRLDDFKDLI